MDDRSIEDVLRDNVRRLMALPGVEGVAQGIRDGTPCIQVFVRNAAVATTMDLPAELDGFAVEVDVSGRFRRR